MATIANWNGHTFEVSPTLIRGFTELRIEGGCETTTKNSSKQKYEERKYGESPTISMKVHLNAQLGVTDVYAEAMELLKEATEGACDYFYLGSSKLVPAKLILTRASIAEIVHLPMSGNTWISCDVQLTFKQGTKNDGSSGSGSGSSGGGSKSKKASVKKSTASPTPVAGPTTQKGLGALLYGKNEKYTAMINKSKAAIQNGKNASASTSSGGLAHQAQRLGVATKTSSSSSTKTSATTGRSTSTAGKSKLSQLKDRI